MKGIMICYPLLSVHGAVYHFVVNMLVHERDILSKEVKLGINVMNANYHLVPIV